MPSNAYVMKAYERTKPNQYQSSIHTRVSYPVTEKSIIPNVENVKTARIPSVDTFIFKKTICLLQNQIQEICHKSHYSQILIYHRTVEITFHLILYYSGAGDTTPQFPGHSKMYPCHSKMMITFHSFYAT